MIYLSAQKSRPQRYHVFTLIELLVVISIISLLISILLPALQSARAAGRNVKCLSNQRQIGIAMAMYSNAFKDQLIPAGITIPNNASGFDNIHWATLLHMNDYLRVPLGSGGSATPITQSASGAQYCPDGLTDQATQWTSSSRTDEDNRRPWVKWIPGTGDRIDTWYAINGGLLTGADADDKFNTFPFSGMSDSMTDQSLLKLHTIGEILKASNMAAIADGVFMHNKWNATQRIGARHKGLTTTNILLMDGHAGSFASDQLATDLDTLIEANDYPNPFWRLDQ